MKALFFSLILCLSPMAFAEGWYAGVGLGLVDPSSDLDGSNYSYENNFSFAMRGGYIFGEQFSFGLNSYTYSKTVGVSSINITPVLFEGLYHFEVYSGGPYAGLRWGRVRESMETNGIDIFSEQESSWGLVGGWNFDRSGHSFMLSVLRNFWVIKIMKF